VSGPRLADVVGQATAVASLRATLRAGRTAHAWCFVGPAGSGKGTTARGFAAALLCARPAPDGDACGACGECVAMGRADHPDCAWVAPPEGKRLLPLAAIQELAAGLALRPARARRRVAVVDGADRCTEEAANALLKTLEEPPGDAVLVLLAEDLLPLPATVRSRCQRLRFGPLPERVIVERLLAAGVAPAEAASRAAAAEGSLGAALHAGTRADAAPPVLEAATLDGAECAARAAALVASAAEGTEGGEAARAGLLDRLAAAGRTCRMDLRAAAAGGGLGPAMARLRALADTREALRRNAAPELAIETLLVRLAGAR
jgi:DNA polymerase-3 subunit delta'